MEARNRQLPEWFNRIRTGQVKLPRFQRFEAWSHDKVTDLLETVLRGLPAGATLVLEIGAAEPFKSRGMVGAPPPTERVTEHLLDGQQRLTALWRSFHDDYADRTYLIRFETEEDGDTPTPVVRVDGQPRWSKAGKRYPLWADQPREVHQKGYIPLRLLRPGDISREITTWCKDAVGNDADAVLGLKDTIADLRDKVTTFNLPFLSLPAGTPKGIALDVFIKMNTSAVQLTAFDIVVAQLEDETGQSLHELVAGIKTQAPSVDYYGDPRDLVLAVAAMREDRAPTQAMYQSLKLSRVAKEWDEIVRGIAFAVDFLEEERVFDGERLPTNAVLPVLAATRDLIPPALDGRGNAKALLRKYIWRAFLTRRYEGAAATRSLQDLRGLRGLLSGRDDKAKPPIFDEQDYPLPDVEQLKRAAWPKAKDILARGVLAITIRAGAHDLADGTPATRAHLAQREYHHLFPHALLTGDGRLDAGESFCALNCALITWNTNRNISAKEPLRYLRERVERSGLGEREIRTRLATHLVPFEALNVGGYTAIQEADERAKRIVEDYRRFLDARAELVAAGVRELSAGRSWTGTA